MSERLYGLPEAEYLYDDPASAYEEWESDIDPIEERDAGRTLTIEEWTVHDKRHHLPTAERLLEWVYEWPDNYGEVTEDYADHLGRAMDRDDVREAAQALIDLIAGRVTYRMAKDIVATHTVTWDEQGEPLLDGEPMYRPSEKATPEVVDLMGQLEQSLRNARALG